MQAPAVVAATTSALTRTVFDQLQAFVQPPVQRLAGVAARVGRLTHG